MDLSNLKGIIQSHYHDSLSNRDNAAVHSCSSGSVSRYLNIVRASEYADRVDDLLNLSDSEFFKIFFPKEKLVIGDNNAEKVVMEGYLEPDFSKYHKDRQNHVKGVTFEYYYELYKNESAEKGLKAYAYSTYTQIYNQEGRGIEPEFKRTYQYGEYCEVDYAGPTIKFTNSETEQQESLQVFVGVLCASRYTFAVAVPSQKSEDFCNAMSMMFQFFQGVPKICRHDNLKAATTKASPYEPVLNNNFIHMLNYFGVKSYPCSSLKPSQKGLVELHVKHIENHLIYPINKKNLVCTRKEIDLEVTKLLNEFNQSQMKRFKSSREELFKSRELATLRPLPTVPYEFADVVVKTVDSCYRVNFDGVTYSVPHQYCGNKVKLTVTRNTIKIYSLYGIHDGKLIAEHVRSYEKGQDQLIADHAPKNHLLSQLPQLWTIPQLREWSKKIGPSCERLVNAKANLPNLCEYKIKKIIFNILNLADGNTQKYPLLEETIKRGLAANKISPRDLRREFSKIYEEYKQKHDGKDIGVTLDEIYNPTLPPNGMKVITSKDGKYAEAIQEADQQAQESNANETATLTVNNAISGWSNISVVNQQTYSGNIQFTNTSTGLRGNDAFTF